MSAGPSAGSRRSVYVDEADYGRYYTKKKPLIPRASGLQEAPEI